MTPEARGLTERGNCRIFWRIRKGHMQSLSDRTAEPCPLCLHVDASEPVASARPETQPTASRLEQPCRRG